MTYLQTTLESAGVRKFITAVILFNAVILGLETSAMVMARVGTFIGILDRICLAIFVVELALKLLAYRFRFFRDGWNIFDFAIVAVSLVPAAQSLSVLRSLRILRILRVVSVAPRLRRVVEGFITALPGMASVFLLMGIIFYIGSVISTKLFGADFPQWFGLARAVGLFSIPDHDIGKLVDGDRAPSDGSISLCLGVFCTLYHGHHLCCGEPAGGFDCKLHAGCAF
jgi:voltage-gated sodium channel